MGEIITDKINQAISSFSISNDLKCLSLSSLDNKIRLYEIATGEILTE